MFRTETALVPRQHHFIFVALLLGGRLQPSTDEPRAGQPGEPTHREEPPRK